MKKMYVTFEEYESRSIEKEEVPLEEIRVGEPFIVVRVVGADHRWPVWERTETGYVQRVDPKKPFSPRDDCKFYRIRE